jgi:hypothetical protein
MRLRGRTLLERGSMPLLYELFGGHLGGQLSANHFASCCHLRRIWSSGYAWHLGSG